MLAWIAAAGRALPALARRHAHSRADQLLLPRRRPGDAQRALPHRGDAWRRGRLRRRGRRARDRATACSVPPIVRSGGWPAIAVEATALVAAAGGFEANIEWMKQYWGDAADNFLIRGTPLQSRHACSSCCSTRASAQVGDPTQCHAVAIDARAPKFDGGIITRLDCVVFGIVVNKQRRSASTTRARTSGRSATRSGAASSPASRTRSPTSSSTRRRSRMFMPSLFPPIEALTDPRTRAASSGSIRRRSRRRLTNFNAAVRPGTFDHTVLDDCRTEGLAPPKSHWARRDRYRRRSMPIRCAPASPSPISGRA